MQMFLLSVSTLIAFWLIVGYMVVRAWVRWARSQTEYSAPKLRSWIAVCGFAASNISLLMIMLVSGGGYFSHAYIPETPLGVLALRVTFFAAFGGICSALVGMGPLRIPAALSSSGSCLALLVHWLGR